MADQRFQPAHIIGGGLAGSEAAWQIAARGVPVVLHEMRPQRTTAAHKTAALAELVCSNSFRSDDQENNAVGLLHEEMRRLGSLIMRAADANQVPAGGALAVDRDGFAAAVTAALAAHPLIEIRREEIAACRPRSGTTSSSPPARSPRRRSPRPSRSSPARTRSPSSTPSRRSSIATSIDMSVAWFQSRYDKAGPGGSGADYINCPLTREQYDAFVDALIAGDKVAFHEWEGTTPYFDGCLPIEVMAERGRETLRHGPMKPFGLTNPHAPEDKAYAVVQLRQDNKLGTLFNMVGFQTKLKHGEQVAHLPHHSGPREGRVRAARRPSPQHLPQFAEAARRDAAAQGRAAPALRRPDHRLRGLCGIGRDRAARRPLRGRRAALGEALAPPPPTTAHGALLAHITGGHVETIDAGPRSFQPMNVNFGLFPPLAHVRSRARTDSGCAAPPRRWPRSARSRRARSPTSSAGSPAVPAQAGTHAVAAE